MGYPIFQSKLCFLEVGLMWLCVCMLSLVWLFAAPWTTACQAPLSMELSRQENWSGLPFPPPWDFPDPGSNPCLSWFLFWQPKSWLCPQNVWNYHLSVRFSSVQLLSRVRLFATPWITARQASLSITNSQSSLKLTSVESVMPSSHLVLCHPLFLLPPIPPSIRVFSNESTLCMRWPKYWSFSFSISPSNEHQGLFSFRMDWLDLLAVQGTLKSLLQHHNINIKLNTRWNLPREPRGLLC